MKWISVKEKLPGDDDNSCKFDWVLVCGEIDDMFLVSIGQYDQGSWDIFDNHGAHSCTGFYSMKSEDITHWMPLPKEPDE